MKRLYVNGYIELPEDCSAVEGVVRFAIRLKQLGHQIQSNQSMPECLHADHFYADVRQEFNVPVKDFR